MSLMCAVLLFLIVSSQISRSHSFTLSPSAGRHQHVPQDSRQWALRLSLSTTAPLVAELEQSINKLKRVLEREYISFFDPMEREYYKSDVKFQDPLTALEGVDKYQNNVDMLAGRSLIGSLLFRDASIILHSVSGGDIRMESSEASTGSSVEIDPIVTRWTLRFTFKALPWAPTPRFSGISRYTVVADGGDCRIVGQQDFWDSINLLPGGTYAAVEKSVALKHFLQQLAPGSLEAPSAGPELPYQTLRIGKDYEVRRYPSYTAAKIQYERRDEAFSAMGSYTSGKLEYVAMA